MSTNLLEFPVLQTLLPACTRCKRRAPSGSICRCGAKFCGQCDTYCRTCDGSLILYKLAVFRDRLKDGLPIQLSTLWSTAGHRN
jgi:hypothetical protein